MHTLSTKKILITGATKGMGLAIAKKLAATGANLILTSRNTEELHATKIRLEHLHPECKISYYTCDFSDNQQLSELIETIDRDIPDLHILINNVGIYLHKSIFDESEEEFELQLQINYITPHRLSRAIGKNMRRNRCGHIINISSVASRQVVSEASTYSVTKFAVKGLTDVLREELRDAGVRVTEIVPGSTFTSSWEGSDLPTSRFVLPEDIADAVSLCLAVSEGANVDELIVRPKYGNI